MTETWRKLLVASILCHLAAFGILLLVSIFSYTTKTVLEEFQWQWIMAHTWSELLRLAPVSQGWATLLTFSWIVPMGGTFSGGTSFERFGASIAFLLVLTVGFSVAFLVGYPAAASRLDSLEFTTTLATHLREAAKDDRDAQNYTRAIAELDQYLVLVGESPQIEQLLIDVRNDARADEARVEKTNTDSSPRVESNASVPDLINRAVAAMEREDYSTAHYMATLALAIDAQNSEAAQIATQALRKLEMLAPSDAESAEAALFRRKQDAKAALTRQDYVAAYYDFESLSEEYPHDVDVQRYLQTARDRVVTLAAFRDEVESALALPGAQDLVFVNRADADSVELIATAKLVITTAGLYAQGVELIDVDSAGRTTRQIYAPYAKLSDGYFLLNVIDRDSPAMDIRPTVFTGFGDITDDTVIKVVPTADQLWTLASISRNPETASIGALATTVATLDRFGLLAEPVQLEFLLRLATPFSFLILSLLLAGVGWRFRSRYLHMPPIPTLALIPAAPFFIMPVYLTLQYAQRILIATVLLSVGMAAAIILVIALQGVLLLVTLSYVALGSRT